MIAGATIADALADATGRLRCVGIENPRAEARLLIGHAVGAGVEFVLGRPEFVLGPPARKKFDEALARRAGREPMSHVLGRREFWSLGFRVTADTLDPRPDSETLIEAALAEIDDRSAPLRLLDMGTGGGCLLLALLSELPNASGIGVDISPAALEIARQNADKLGFGHRAEFRRADWDDDLDGIFDLIVSNPPYIPTGTIDGLEPEIALFEPRLALDGGEDGLAAYRDLAPAIARRLDRHGVAVVEFGAGQADPVARIMGSRGLDKVALRNDLGGDPRCFVFRSKPILTGC